MQDEIKLLFETRINGKPLFSSQLDLVNAILTNPRTKYYVPQNDPELFAKSQNRLKAYVSQLLSTTVSRNVNEDFISALRLVISSRLAGNEEQTVAIVSAVIDAIRGKNSSIAKAEIKTTPIDQFISDISNGRYIAVITSRPLEIEVQERNSLPNLRNVLFFDLISQLYNENKDLKYYRFNFPTDAFGDLFWRGLRRILFRQFKAHPSPQLFESLQSKLGIDISENENFTDNLIQKIVYETLLKLNSNKYILVFTTSAPIYGFPIVAIDPSDTNNNKVYSILESEKMTLLKLPDNETLLWRLFVWDVLKSKKYAGQSIPYSND
jgi:hypothetical protein